MKKALVVLLSMLTFQALCQEKSTSPSPLFRVSSISAGVGNLTTFYQDVDFGQLKNITVNSKNFYKENLDGYESQYYNDGNSTTVYLNLGLMPYSKKIGQYNDLQEVEIGLLFNSGFRRSFTYMNENEYPLDNINFHGVEFTADSVTNSSIYYDEFVNDLSLSLAWLFKTNPQKRISVFGGIESNVGFSVFSRVQKDIFSDTLLLIKSDGYISSYKSYPGKKTDYGFYLEEELENRMIFRAAVPVGISLRLSKKHSLFKQTSLFARGKFGFEFQSISNKYHYTNPLLAFSTGIKVTIN